MKQKHLEVSLLDPDKFVKANELKEISNPIFFVRNNIPTSDGLLSNEIFGITKDDRANIFAYIDLHETFLHPLSYKIWSKMDKKVRNVIHGVGSYSINSTGQLVETENGNTGIKFLKDNIDKIKIKATDSDKRDRNIQFFMKNKDKMFITKMPVIPAYYRDVNTDNGHVGVGEINELYNSLIIAVRALKESADYGLTLSDSTRGRIQETLLQIYSWFGSEPQLVGKRGIIRRAVNSKTTDYATRLVLSASDLKVESIDDLYVDLDHSAVPLASVCTNFFPFILFHVRRFFENEFSGDGYYNYIDKSGTLQKIAVKDYQIEFSEDRIKKEIDRFMYGYSNRFIPIKVPNEEGKEIYMSFKGRSIPAEQYDKQGIGEVPLLGRDLTWCDVFFMAAVEATKDRCILVTRFPIDTYQNQFPSMIVVNSTKVTEPMVVNNTFYARFPKIRQEDILTNTSNLFIDTMQISNLYLGGIGGDYR